MSKSPINVSANKIDPINCGIIHNAIDFRKIEDGAKASENEPLSLVRADCSTKAQIMDAAAKRFAHYGYSKTTIADISADCKMSAGNIYRYFGSKLDIAAAITHDTGVQVITNLRQKIQQKTKARDRLRVFLFSSLRTTFRQLAETPRLVDMANSVRKHRPEVRRKIRKIERRLLVEVLKYGRKTGEFRVDCAQSTARVIQCLVSRFRWPQLRAPEAKLPRLETELEGTLAMVLSALGAGCLLGAIMRRHPKIEDNSQENSQDSRDESEKYEDEKEEREIACQTNPNNATQ